MKRLLIVCFLSACCIATRGQAGSLDPLFGKNGLVMTDFALNGASSFLFCRYVLVHPDGSLYLVLELAEQTFISHRFANGALDMAYGENGYSVPFRMTEPKAALQPDGKVVAAGTVFINENHDFTVVRLNTNGFLDNSFSGDGIQYTDFVGNSDVFRDIALQPDGKIIVAGTAGGSFALARYNPDGSPDNSFDSDGKLIDFSTPANASGVALQPDGKILVAGMIPAGSFASMAVARYLPNGAPDNSFSGDGKQTVQAGSYSAAADVALKADGRIVLGGYTVNVNNGNLDFAIAQLLSTGELDNSFSGDGMQTTEFGSNQDDLEAIAVQADGKIIAGGISFVNGPPNLILARYNTDGLLDNSFSGDGWLVTPPGGTAGLIFSVVLQPDEKILAGGVCTNGYSVLRFNTDGNPDNSFDGDGVVADKKPGGTTNYYASAVQPDGKIVAAGGAAGFDFAYDFAVARYNPDGSLDNSFSGDGKVTIEFSPNSDLCFAMAIQPDGKIIMAGHSLNGASVDAVLVRVNADGSLDNSFSGDGKLVLPDFGGHEILYDLQLQPDGKIVVAGSITNPLNLPENQDFLLARLNADGTLDNSFSGDGILRFDFGTANDWANALLIQPDGKIVAIGVSAWQSNNSNIAIVRFNANGDLDPAFDFDGKVTTDYGGGRDFASSAALLPDGRFIIAGSTTNFNGNEFAFARYNPNGSLDNSFSGDGILNYNGGSTTENATSIALQQDGKILVGGHSHGGSNNDFALLRFLPDGTPDNSFSGDGKVVQDFGLGEDIIESISIWNNRVYVAGRTAYGLNVGALAAYLIGEPCTVNVTIPDAMALSEGVNANMVYIGYAPAGQITLTAQPLGGTAPYSYLWSNGATTQSVVVSPVVATTYSVTITDAQACSKTASKLVNVMDVRCGNKLDKVLVCHNSGTNCVSPNAVPAFLRKGGNLGNCNLITGVNRREINESEVLKVSVTPNPGRGVFTLDISGNNSEVELTVYDIAGRKMEVRNVFVNRRMQLGEAYRPGVYFLRVRQGREEEVVKLVKME